MGKRLWESLHDTMIIRFSNMVSLLLSHYNAVHSVLSPTSSFNVYTRENHGIIISVARLWSSAYQKKTLCSTILHSVSFLLQCSRETTCFASRAAGRERDQSHPSVQPVVKMKHGWLTVCLTEEPWDSGRTTFYVLGSFFKDSDTLWPQL